MNNQKIIFYGAQWCPDCRKSKQILDANTIDYEYIDLETNKNAVDTVTRINNGLQRIPTIVFPDGDILVEPKNEELLKKLGVRYK